jgi:hypothetical protein
VVQSEWNERTSDVIKDFWPLNLVAPPFVPQQEGGIGAYAEYVDSCCAECDLCPTIGFSGENVTHQTLDRIDIIVCWRELLSTLNTTQALVEAFEPPLDATIIGTPEWDRSEITETQHWAYRWIDHGRRIGLQVAVVLSEERWGAFVSFGQCPKPIEVWADPDDGPLLILGNQQFQGDDGDRWLSVEYLTECHSRDLECRDSEMRRIRPRALREAEAEKLVEVHVSASDCVGTTMTAASWTKGPSGQWSDEEN